MKKYLLAASVLLAVIILSGIAILLVSKERPYETGDSGSKAVIAYQTVYKVATFGRSEVINPEMTFYVRVLSNLPDIDPTDISFYIDSVSGSIPLKIDNNGVFELPFSKELLEENPMLVTNQPKGTMSLQGALRFNRDPENPSQKVPYSAIVMPATWTIWAHRNLRVEGSDQKPAPVVNGINIRIEEHLGKKIVIHAREKEITLKPNDKGICFIPYDDALLKENPMVTLPDSRIDTMGVVTDKGG